MNKVAVYPENFEDKIGFSTIREHLLFHCSSALGRSVLASLSASGMYEEVQRNLSEVSDMLCLLSSEAGLPSLNLRDCRDELLHIRPDRTYLEEKDLFELSSMLSSLHALHDYFTLKTSMGSIEDDSLGYLYPSLSAIYIDSPTFPKLERSLKDLLDLEGNLKDTASRELYRIRSELRDTERSLSGILARIMKSARTEGWIDPDTKATIRDGRLVIPVAPEHKRRIKGIVHDESATGKTVFIEPVEMVEANNHIRELEALEQREEIRILRDISSKIRPNISHLITAYDLLAYTDSILAKAKWAKAHNAVIPSLIDRSEITFLGARHPLLEQSLKEQDRTIVPLDVELNGQVRMLVISGPNAGGKSVCLKTVGLLQYMAQAGLPIPVYEGSQVGIFSKFFIDIGDEQSLEDDLSTYSSHLSNMKHFEKHSDASTLILIDEFGGGTEPTIGGAIAQALLAKYNSKHAKGIITTHYHNLKTYAEEHDGLSNAAMLYDRREMRPLFKLSIGRPGSSFAVEIARKIGLSEEVIEHASFIVGSEYINMDKFLQDIVRDKRYWEEKRQSIRREERQLQETTLHYLKQVNEIEKQRKEILQQAKQEARCLIEEANGRIEKTIKEIREAEAAREQTQFLRRDLKAFQEEIDKEIEPDNQAKEKAKRELEKLLRRRDRKEKGNDRADEASIAQYFRAFHRLADKEEQPPISSFNVGDHVRIDGQKTIATVLTLKGNKATIAIGAIKMKVALERLKHATKEQIKKQNSQRKHSNTSLSRSLIEQIHDKRLHFKQDIDIRGMRVEEGISIVQSYIDEALQLGIPRVRLLHGTGTGALKQAIRSHLASRKNILRYADEHIQLGGAGITVVDFL